MMSDEPVDNELDEFSTIMLEQMDRALERAAAAVFKLKKNQPWIDSNQAMALYVEGFVKLRGK